MDGSRYCLAVASAHESGNHKEPLERHMCTSQTSTSGSGVMMRDKFPWYFFEKDDYEAAWSDGILTVDANVILDLYRYNQSTREA